MFKRSSDYISLSHASRRILSASVAIIALLPCRDAIAQDMFMYDTVKIQAVTVTAAASGRFSPGTVLSIDT
ncbi:MAG: hypothetical protein ABR560_06165, partial [Bacteroidales bacterium]